MIDAEQLKRNILDDMRVELSGEFHKNFERKAFFSDKWKPRAKKGGKGSLLVVAGTLRRSIKAEVRGNGVRFSSAVPYATIHNEGGEGTKPKAFAYTDEQEGQNVHGQGAQPQVLHAQASVRGRWGANAENYQGGYRRQSQRL